MPNAHDIILSRNQIDSIVAHAVSGLPNEVCGILAGRGNRVFDVIPIKNADPSPVGYFMDTSQQIRAIRMMRKKGLNQVGIYHSHTESDALPSAKDVELAFHPGPAYVILSLAGLHPELKAFEINKGLVKERFIVIDRNLKATEGVDDV